MHRDVPEIEVCTTHRVHHLSFVFDVHTVAGIAEWLTDYLPESVSLFLWLLGYWGTGT